MARILIVDDNLLIRSLLRQILSSGGHDVVADAQTGAEAISCYAALGPDLVTVDLVMPDQDGLATLVQMKAIDQRAKAIICSAHLTERRVVAALKLGAQGFIRKPFDRETVLDTVAQVLGEGRAAGSPQLPGLHGSVVDDEVGGDDRREFARVEIEVPLMLTPGGTAPITASTIDISGGGMQIVAPPLTPGTSLGFWVDLGPGYGPVEGRARVVRTAGEGRQALTFEHVSVADHERLVAYIRERQAGPAQ